MLVHKDRLTGSTSSGSLELTTSRFSGVLCSQVICEPATATTTYDIAITDSDGETVFERLAEEGNIRIETRIPMAGTYTVTISGASADEAFVVKLGTEEN